ncbi:Prostaglandin E synthase 3 (Cytosolic) [Desmophyllum pertusum]|uniref:Prostaglandin E synthase 3 (Cytosolic) n=1 Tax=Desmophyllum pertusum TaxID=174260 RepID=A0A9W9ZYV6_9CNID|nr:Prostaglandin E synthase 3 (Cytosolic) [Desmophyllum pertusum]
MGEVKTLSPSTRWAQRKDRVFLTIEVEDCQTPEIKLDSQALHFSAKGGKEQKMYSFDLEFYGQVIPEKSKQRITAREVTFNIMKKEEGPYWPRLHKEGKKPSFLHTDFSKWKDEDDSEGKTMEWMTILKL